MISGLVPKTIVHRLETIEIEIDRRQQLAVALIQVTAAFDTADQGLPGLGQARLAQALFQQQTLGPGETREMPLAFIVKPELAGKVTFANLNLLICGDYPERNFDVIFLRNVLIYFNDETKARVLTQLCNLLRPDGYLLVGHSEIIRQQDLPLVQEAPSRYRCLPLQPKELP